MSCLFEDSHSDPCEVYLTVILVCVSLMISGVELLLMCLLAMRVCVCVCVCVCLVRSNAHFLTEFFS